MGSLLLGSLVAGTVLLDGLFERFVFLGAYSLEKPFPYTLTIALLLVLTTATLATGRSSYLFACRHEIAIAALLVVGAVNGLNIGSLDATDPTILIAFYAWVILFVFERLPFRVPTTVLVLCLAVLCCSVLSAANGGMATLMGHRTLLVRLVLVVLLGSWIAATGGTRFTVRLIIAIAVASAVVGLAMSVIFVGTGDVLTTYDTGAEVYKSTPFGRMVRATGLTATAQCFAHLLLIGVALALFAPMHRLWRIVMVLIMIAGIGWTFTVGGYLTLAGVLALWLFMRWPEKSLHLLLAIVGVGCVLYLTGWAGYVYEELIVALGGKGTHDRMETLAQGLVAIRDHPWIGVGLRNTDRVTPSYVHNTYLQLASEIGVPGAIAFAGLGTYPVARLAAAVKGTPRGERQDWLKALFLASFTLVLHLSIEPFYDNYFTWAFIGVAVGSIGEISVARSRHSILASRATPRAGGEQ
jgi:O-antigen ligase